MSSRIVDAAAGIVPVHFEGAQVQRFQEFSERARAVPVGDDGGVLGGEQLCDAGDGRSRPRSRSSPYINGTPAGLPRRAEVFWLERVLYVGDLTAARLACLVPDALGKLFGNPTITAALGYCYPATYRIAIKHDESAIA